MIHHISIAARDPQRVAAVLAELFGGHSFPFPPFPGGYIALPSDPLGTAVEVIPLGDELVPGAEGEQVSSRASERPSDYTATHAAISVPVSEERIKEIAAREGWRAETFNRIGVFGLVEFWLENRLLVELLPPEMQGQYLDFMTPENYAALFGYEYTPRAPAEPEPVAAGAEPALQRHHGFEAFW